ncbi:MAG: bifunctional ornithine acetyltransferase/N-acetylglutamate synthase, partial [bacterium]
MAIGNFTTSFNVVPGVRLASLACGIKGDKTDDLVLFEFSDGSTTAGVFTQSLFAAAPVEVDKRHLSVSSPKYFLVNSGNANAATGEEGIGDAIACCQSLSQLTGVRPETILPFSTGVIGERLPVNNITDALDDLLNRLSGSNWLEAARGIMTTDTQPKICSKQVLIDDVEVTITGIVKGSGMIQPNMATMLCYIATDVKCGTGTLQTLLSGAMEHSFNRITVDSDTSTNDSCMLTATGLSGVDIDVS